MTIQKTRRTTTMAAAVGRAVRCDVAMLQLRTQQVHLRVLHQLHRGVWERWAAPALGLASLHGRWALPATTVRLLQTTRAWYSFHPMN